MKSKNLAFSVHQYAPELNKILFTQDGGRTFVDISHMFSDECLKSLSICKSKAEMVRRIREKMRPTQFCRLVSVTYKYNGLKDRRYTGRIEGYKHFAGILVELDTRRDQSIGREVKMFTKYLSI